VIGSDLPLSRESGEQILDWLTSLLLK